MLAVERGASLVFRAHNPLKRSKVQLCNALRVPDGNDNPILTASLLAAAYGNVVEQISENISRENISRFKLSGHRTASWSSLRSRGMPFR
jgi:hypothetical protein